MVRVVRPGGHVVIVNHFSAPSGPRAAVEKWLSRYAGQLGWHPEFDREIVLRPAGTEAHLPIAGFSPSASTPSWFSPHLTCYRARTLC